MSRGFVKEDDQEEAPFIPPRAALPLNVPNYVTKKGMEMLLQEKKKLEEQRSNLTAENDAERRKALAVVNGKIELLNERINSAQLIEPTTQTQNEVRFGATVKYKVLTGRLKGKQNHFTIVGVDEASVKDHKIAFVAPIAKALTGKKVGEKVIFSMGEEKQEFEVLEIDYKL